MDLKKPEKFKENPQAKGVRILMAVLFFVQVILTTFPYMKGEVDADHIGSLTAFGIVIHFQSYNNLSYFKFAMICAVLVVFPAVSFFFCILDRKTNIKNFVSAACCLVCAGIITFGIATMLDIGSLIALILYVIILFITVLGFQASVLRNKDDVNPEQKLKK